ncbi:hypothetical protein [Roseovarius sp.]|uniref:hypothetical protein n=1 Tax=Roseovarius sp. TaxID=1486281 RepID=UPI0035627634
MTGLPGSISLKTPGVMSTAELAKWAQVGKNTVPRLVARFGLREITQFSKNHRFPVHDVLRKVLGVTPETPEDLERLLTPLQKVSWVSQTTGMSVSAISASVCEKRGPLPYPVQLSVTGQDQAPARGRRWVPAQVEAHLRGDPIPFLASQTSLPKAPSKHAPPSARNVFAEICGSNAEVSRQLQL